MTHARCSDCGCLAPYHRDSCSKMKELAEQVRRLAMDARVSCPMCKRLVWEVDGSVVYCATCSTRMPRALRNRIEVEVEGPRGEAAKGLLTEHDVRRLVEQAGGKFESAAELPDGSGCATATFPLPKDHWLYERPEGPLEEPIPVLRYGFVNLPPDTGRWWRERLVEAARYAVRASTRCGRDTDWDPDALVQNLLVALLGSDPVVREGAPGSTLAATHEAFRKQGVMARTDRVPLNISVDVHTARQLWRALIASFGDEGRCMCAGPDRRECEVEIGLPGRSIPGQHDGDDDTVDVYGRPNGWCWICWYKHQLREREHELLQLPARLLEDVGLLEALAAVEHARWSGWEKYREKVDGEESRARWERQRETAYADLSESEKESDRVEARRSLDVVVAALRRIVE